MGEDIPDWMRDGLAHVWRPYTAMKNAAPPLPVVRTEGVRLHLADGSVLIDGIASWWTAAHGYNHPHIVEALRKQAETMPHVMFGGLAHEPAWRLAGRLSDMFLGDLSRVFFAESGSVSVEIAMKMALQFWLNNGVRGRTKFVSFRGGYHGDTLATMTICDPEEGMHAMFAGVLPAQHVVALPRDEESTAALDRLLAEKQSEIAAIIVEPMVQGAGGMIFHDAATLTRVRALADRYGLLLILDEIFTGFGRTGRLFAMDHTDVIPDIVTLSKALTGGVLPLSCAVANERVFSAFWSDDPAKALMHGPTYMANPMACAAANAALDIIGTGAWKSDVPRIARGLHEGLSPCRDLPGVRDVRVLGAIGVVELEAEPDRAALTRRFAARGVWIRPMGRVVYLTPALNIGDDDLATLTSSISGVLAEPSIP